MVDIRLQSEVPSDDAVEIVEPKNLVTPGSIITRGTDFMRSDPPHIFKCVPFDIILFILLCVSEVMEHTCKMIVCIQVLLVSWSASTR